MKANFNHSNYKNQFHTVKLEDLYGENCRHIKNKNVQTSFYQNKDSCHNKEFQNIILSSKRNGVNDTNNIITTNNKDKENKIKNIENVNAVDYNSNRTYESLYEKKKIFTKQTSIQSYNNKEKGKKAKEKNENRIIKTSSVEEETERIVPELSNRINVQFNPTIYKPKVTIDKKSLTRNFLKLSKYNFLHIMKFMNSFDLLHLLRTSTFISAKLFKIISHTSEEIISDLYSKLNGLLELVDHYLCYSSSSLKLRVICKKTKSLSILDKIFNNEVDLTFMIHYLYSLNDKDYFSDIFLIDDINNERNNKIRKQNPKIIIYSNLVDSNSNKSNLNLEYKEKGFYQRINFIYNEHDVFIMTNANSNIFLNNTSMGKLYNEEFNFLDKTHYNESNDFQIPYSQSKEVITNSSLNNRLCSELKKYNKYAYDVNNSNEENALMVLSFDIIHEAKGLLKYVALSVYTEKNIVNSWIHALLTESNLLSTNILSNLSLRWKNSTLVNGNRLKLIKEYFSSLFIIKNIEYDIDKYYIYKITCEFDFSYIYNKLDKQMKQEFSEINIPDDQDSPSHRSYFSNYFSIDKNILTIHKSKYIHFDFIYLIKQEDYKLERDSLLKKIGNIFTKENKTSNNFKELYYLKIIDKVSSINVNKYFEDISQDNMEIENLENLISEYDNNESIYKTSNLKYKKRIDLINKDVMNNELSISCWNYKSSFSNEKFIILNNKQSLVLYIKELNY